MSVIPFRRSKRVYTYEELMQMEPDKVTWETAPKTTAYLLPDLNTYQATGDPFESQLVVAGFPTMLGDMRTTKKFYASDVLVAMFSNMDLPVVDIRPPKPYRKIRSLHLEEVLL